MTTLNSLFEPHRPSSTAVIIPDGPVHQSYHDLYWAASERAFAFLSMGVTKGDVIAMACGNNVNFLPVFLGATAIGAIAAPLNPAYKEAEFHAYFHRLSPVIVAVDDPTCTAAKVARARRIRVVAPGQRGESPPCPPKDVEPSDTALALFTSGTTGDPKLVPLSHSNLLHSCSNIAGSYGLSSSDSTLVVMPLFHVHGLIGAALSTLYSGGTIILPPKFSASSFWDQAVLATWYTASPTIHHILTRLDPSEEEARQCRQVGGPFRFIRSCSAALDPELRAWMEGRWKVPVVEAYGMTEAAHQVSTQRIGGGGEGTVGYGVGVGIEIRDGRIIISGPNVMDGYEGEAPLIDGKLDTGDTGEMTEEGLRLLGRSKEMINRGGETIAPLEIDTCLNSHPAVSEAVAFGVPDEKYGEVVHAAVILCGPTLEAQLIRFCETYLADFKVPVRIHFVDEFPRTAAGKVQRSALASQLGEDNGSRP